MSIDALFFCCFGLSRPADPGTEQCCKLIATMVGVEIAFEKRAGRTHNESSVQKNATKLNRVSSRDFHFQLFPPHVASCFSCFLFFSLSVTPRATMLEIYEDPASPQTPIPMKSSSAVKPLPSGRTPLGKRTNQGSALDSNKTKGGLEKSRSVSRTVAIIPAPQAENVLSNNKRVHFGNKQISEVVATPMEVPPQQTSPIRSAQGMNEFRRALRTTRTPATPASALTRSSTLMSPHTLLETEMESTPDDSLLVSPAIPRAVTRRARPSLIGGRKLSQKPQRVVPGAVTADVTEEALPSVPPTTQPPEKPKSASTLPSQKENSLLHRSNTSKHINTTTTRLAAVQNSRLSRRVPSPKVATNNQKRVIVNSDAALTQPIKTTVEKKNMIVIESQKLVRKVVSTQREQGCPPKLEVAVHPTPQPIVSVPLSQTNQTSAWKSAHTSIFADSPIQSTPKGVCLDLSNVFQEAQSRPPTAHKAHTMSEETGKPQSHAASPALQASQAQQQCEVFTNWLNVTMCPDEDTHAENDPWRSLAVHQRMAHVRQKARALWQSEEMQRIRDVVESEINKGKIQIRADRDLHADLTQRKALLTLLLGSYETPWLRLGLETLSGQTIEPKRKKVPSDESRFDLKPVEKSSLSRMQVALRDFIVNRVLFDQGVLAKYTKGKCKVPSGQFEVEYKADMRMLVLYRVMVLMFYLDHAKQAHLLEQTLFRKQSSQKSSKEMLAGFCRLFLASSGDVVKQFQRVGLRVYHKQDPLDEIDFVVKNIATDLRDGIRLGRLTEVLTASTYQSLLRQLRVPAISRLPKIHNVNIVLERLGQEFTLPAGVAPHHVVDGHREKVLQLLWALVAHFCLPDFLKPSLLQNEINRIERSRGEVISNFENSTEKLSEDSLVELILQWTNAVFLDFGLAVANLSSDWADGVPCCLLIHFYHPEILEVKKINPTRRRDYCFHRKLPPNMSEDSIHRNERDNWELAGQSMMRLGSMTGLPSADSGSPPNERTTLMAIAFLCERLIESSAQERACRLLQRFVRRKHRLARWKAKIRATKVIARAWTCHKKNYYRAQRYIYGHAVLCIEKFVWQRFDRLKELKLQRLQRQESFLAAVLIQAITRQRLVRRKFTEDLTRYRASIKIQSAWRQVRALQERLILKMEQDSAVFLQYWWRRQVLLTPHRHQAAVCIQKRWRGFWTRIECDIAVLDAMDLQKYIRRGLAVLELKRRRNAVALIQRKARVYLSCQKAREIRLKRLLHVSSTCIQKHVRRFFAERLFFGLLEEYRAARMIQTLWRCVSQKIEFQTMRKKTIAIQAFFRMKVSLAHFHGTKESVILLQSFCRRRIALLPFKAKIWAATCLQKHTRRCQAIVIARCRRAAILIIQCFARCTLAKKLRLELIATKQFAACQLIQSWWRSKKCLWSFSCFRTATIRIQSKFRGWYCCHHYRKVWMAAVSLQRCGRSFVARQKYVRLKTKVILCQAAIRKHLTIEHCKRQLGAAVLVQTSVRKWQAKCFVQRERSRRIQVRNAAVMSIQTWFRMSMARKLFKSTKVAAILVQSAFRRFSSKHYLVRAKVATVCIQSRYRVHLAEKRVALLQLSFREKHRRKNWAATVLQSWARGYRLRSFIVRQCRAAECIQKNFRTFISVRFYRRACLAVETIQKIWRRRLACNVAHCRRTSILCLQSSCRLFLAKRSLKRLLQERLKNKAATTIQCLVRCSFSRQILTDLIYEKWHAQECEKSAIIIQRAFRNFLVPFRAARTIQKTWRCYSTLVDYCWTVLAVYTIQSVVRRHFAVQECNSRRYAVYVLQNFGKTVIARRRKGYYLQKVIQIQSLFRGFQVRCDQELQHLAASIIQRRIRGNLARSRLLKRSWAACQIQRIWRGFDVYANYMCSIVAATTIQTAYRRHRAEVMRQIMATERTVEFLKRRRSAVRIQKAFRWHKNRHLWKQSALHIQCAWKAYRSRRGFSFLRRSVAKIQSRLRGHLVRRQRSKQIRRIVERLHQIDDSPHLRLGHKTRAALEIIARSLSLSEIMGATKTLEIATRWSAECCRLLVDAGATTILFSLIRTCNRSLPHKELLQVALRTILNVCRHSGWDDSCPDGAGACVDLVQIFRDKPEIFVPAVKLLHIAVRSSQQSRAWCGSPENAKRLNNVYKLCTRKQPRGSSPSDMAVRKAIKMLLLVVRLVSSE